MSQLNVGRLNISERLKLPNYNESQRDALSAELGMMIYNTTSELVEVYNGSNWTNAVLSILHLMVVVGFFYGT